MVTGRSGQHLPLPSPTVPPALSESGALSSNPTSVISQLHDFGQSSFQGLFPAAAGEPLLQASQPLWGIDVIIPISRTRKPRPLSLFKQHLSYLKT